MAITVRNRFRAGNWVNHGRYNGARSLYQMALWRADYFAWKARKGFAPTGNCPVTGMPYSIHNAEASGLGRHMHMAAATMYLRKAREIRATMGV